MRPKILFLAFLCAITTTVCSEENSMKSAQDAIQQNKLGLEMLQTNNIEKSIEYFKKAIELDSSIPEYHNNLGFSYYNISDFSEAKKHYLKSIQIDDSYSQGYYNMGVLLQKTKDLEGAIDYYKKTLKYNNEYPEAVYNHALVSMMLGRKKDAIQGFEKFINLAGSKYPGPAADAKKRIQDLKK